MRTLLVLAVIAGVGATAWYVYQRPTVARGAVFAAQFLDRSPTLARVDCDDEIPIGVSGAKFNCEFIAKDGDRAKLEITMDRAGMMKPRVVSETAPEHRHVAASGDPWE